MTPEKLIIHIIYTPGTVLLARPFVRSLLRWSGARFRLVPNGCGPEERAQLRDLCLGEARLQYLETPWLGIERHGIALNWLLERCDSRWFCAMDSDIFADGPVLVEAARALEYSAGVFSAMPIWVREDEAVFPRGFRGLSGEYMRDQTGRCLGVTYLAFYESDVLRRNMVRYGIGFEAREWNEVPERLRGVLAARGLNGVHFDTGKLLNALLGFSFKLTSVKEPALVHIGGASFEVLRPEFRNPRLEWLAIFRSARFHARRLGWKEAFTIARRRLRQRDPVRRQMLRAMATEGRTEAIVRTGVAEVDLRLGEAIRRFGKAA